MALTGCHIGRLPKPQEDGRRLIGAHEKDLITRAYIHTHTHTPVFVRRPTLSSSLWFLSLRVTSKVTSPTSTRSSWSVNRTRSLLSPPSPRLFYPQSPLAVMLQRRPFLFHSIHIFLFCTVKMLLNKTDAGLYSEYQIDY